MSIEALLTEASRQLGVCNACRYCEGYCAVFPAIERRRTFELGDVTHLANLCHDCRACYYACMYAPPHEFAVNIPRVLSAVRAETYRRYAWPAVASRLLASGRLRVAGLSAVASVVIALLVGTFGGAGALEDAARPAGFYAVVPYVAMLVPAMAVSVYGLAVLAAGTRRFWREAGGSIRDLVDLRALRTAAAEALTLRYLRGGGPGCPYPWDVPSRLRRALHHAVFYGFGAAFVSTILAAIEQDMLGIQPPYPLASGPVLFGIAGGLAMVVGATGLIAIKIRSDERPAEVEVLDLDYGFLLALDLASLTGLLLLAFRSTPAMGVLLVLHLGTLAGFYVTAPYGKFAHFFYRYEALVRNALEARAEHGPGASRRQSRNDGSRRSRRRSSPGHSSSPKRLRTPGW